MAHKQRAALAKPDGSRTRSRPARRRLLEAARDLARTRGYEQLQVRDVTERAHVSRETFYTHFADKRECLTEACDPELAAIAGRLNRAGEDGRPWAAPMLAALDETLGGLYDSPESTRSRLLSAMTDAVATKGYPATRLAEVIRAAGASYPAFYRRFTGKQDCFAAAYGALLDRVEAEVGSSAVPGLGSEPILTGLAELLAAEPDRARILIAETGRLPAEPLAGPGYAHARSLAELLSRLLFGVAEQPATDGSARNPARSLAVGSILETLRRAAVQNEIELLPTQLSGLAPLIDPMLAGDRSRNNVAPLRRRARDGHSRRRIASAAG